MIDKIKIKAVLDDEISEALKEYGVLESVIAGNFLCDNCGKKLTIENIYSIHVKDGKVSIKCDDENCNSI